MPSRFRLDRSPKCAAAVLLAATALFAASPAATPVPVTIAPRPIVPPPPSVSSPPGTVAPRIRPGAAFPVPPYAPHAPHDLIVKFRDGVASPLRLDLRTELRATPRSRFRVGAEQWRLPAGESIEDAIARLSADPRVEYAEPNYLLRADRLPDDPRLVEQYALRNTGQTGGTAGADLDALRAWNIATGDPGAPGAGHAGVIIGIIDSGTDQRHPDLHDSLFINPGEIPDNGLDDDGNGFVDDVTGWDFANGDNDPFDDAYHGTHVSGIAAATGDNGIGIAGVAWRARLLPVKFLAADGTGFSADAIHAIDYAALMGARVLNNSWGGGAFSNIMFDTIAAVGTDGVLFVAAAGNDTENIDINPHYPASYNLPNLIAVAATDDEDGIGTFSSYGARSVLLGAPGVGILSTLPGKAYGLLSGTSMAAPMVSGAVALLLSAEPGLTIPEVRARIAASARPVPALQGKTVTGGRLDLFRLLAHPDAIPPAAVGGLQIVETGSGHVRLRFTASGDDGLEGRASTYDVRYAAGVLDPAHLDQATAFVNGFVPGPSGGVERIEVSGLAPATSYQFAVRALDEWDSAGPPSAIVTATTLAAPVFASDPPDLALTLPAGREGERTIAVTNAGPGTLDWSAEALEETASGGTAPAAWVTLVPPSGRVGAGATAPLLLHVRSAGLAPGPHAATILLRSNDPARPSAEHTLRVDVRDAATLAVTPAAIDFGQVVVGTSTFRLITLANLGTAALDILGFESDDPAVLPPSGPASIPPGSAVTLAVRFVPDAARAVDARVRIDALADNATEVAPIVVRGEGLGPPAIAVTPASITAALRAGASKTLPLSIGNDGGSVLQVHVEVGAADLGESAASWLDPRPADLTIPAGEAATLDVVIAAAALPPGEHTALLRLATNIPGAAPVEIPVAIRVNAGAHLILEAPDVVLESRQQFDTSGATTAHRIDAPLPPRAGGTVMLKVEGDYGNRIESTRLLLEGRDLGTLRGGDAGSGTPGGDNGGVLPPDCAEVSMTRSLDAASLADLLADGVVEAQAANSAAVDPSCAINRHTLRISYAPRLDRIEFGSLLPGVARRRQLTARNAGSEPLHGTLRLDGDARFSIVPASLNLDAGAAATVTLLFRADGGAADAAARLDLDSDDPDQPHLEATLHASTAPLPAIDAAPVAIETTLLEGRSESHPVLLANRGSEPLTLSLAIGPGEETTAPADCRPEALYAAAFNTGEIRERDLATGAERTAASGLFGPRGIALGPDGRRLYATEFNGRLAIADLVSGGAPARFGLGVATPSAVALDPRGESAWITGYGTGDIANLDLRTGTVRVAAGGLFGPHGLALDPGGRFAYVAEESRGTLARVDLLSGGSITLAAGLDTVTGLALDPATAQAYVALPVRGAVAAIDLVTGAVHDIAADLAGPNEVLLDPARQRLYVSEFSGGRVSAIDLATGIRTTVIPSIPNPTGLALRLPAVCSARFARLADARLLIPAGGTVTAPILFDSTGMPEGRRAATLVAGPASPFLPLVRVPLALSVVSRPRIGLFGETQSAESTATFLGAAARTTHTLRFTIPPGTPGRLEVTIEGDFGSPKEMADVIIEGTLVGSLGAAGNDCIATTRVFSLPLPFLRTVTQNGTVDVVMQNSTDVVSTCPLNRHRVRLTYDNADPATGIDLGAFDPGQGRTVGLTVRNTGFASLDVTDVGASDPACTVSPTVFSVVPGGLRNLILRCAPAQGGPFSATLRIASNDPDRPVLESSIFAAVNEPDRDHDGVADARDVCPDVADPDQADRDGDLVGDRCDDCPDAPNPGQGDVDADGSGDACQPTARIEEIREDGGSRLEVQAALADPQGDLLSGTVILAPVGALQGAVVLPFTGRLPALSDISALPPGTRCRLEIRVSDGSSLPATATAEFLHRQETVLVIDRPPRPAFSAPEVVECDRPLAGRARLDGRATADDDSTPGTSDDVAAWEWFARLETGTLVPVASLPVADADLPLGAAAIVLRVTDAAGESAEAERPVQVRDTQPPAMTLAADPGVLWPPDHRLHEVRLGLAGVDACDPAPVSRLVRATSSEPDDAPGSGDGATTGDIETIAAGDGAGALAGCEAIRLRAERSGGGPGRVYRVVCETRDRSGNSAATETIVTVPSRP